MYASTVQVTIESGDWCRLFHAKPLHKPMFTRGQLDPTRQTSVTLFLRHENTQENVDCKMSAISFRPECAKWEMVAS